MFPHHTKLNAKNNFLQHHDLVTIILIMPLSNSFHAQRAMQHLVDKESERQHKLTQQPSRPICSNSDEGVESSESSYFRCFCWKWRISSTEYDKCFSERVKQNSKPFSRLHYYALECAARKEIICHTQRRIFMFHRVLNTAFLGIY